MWNTYLINILVNQLNFKQSLHDEYLFFYGKMIYLLYTDDSIIAGPDKKEIDNIIKEIKDYKLDITILGNLKDFLSVNILKEADGHIYVSQSHLIK